MRQIIKRILTEVTNPKLEKVVTILLRKYPNPMEDLKGGIDYLKELGFDDKEVGKIFQHYFKGVFTNRPSSETYYQVFDKIFKIDKIKPQFEVVYDEDEYGDDYQLMNWYDVGYWGDTDQGRIMNNTKAPYLDIDSDYLMLLRSIFGSKWEEPFKKWFEERFDLKVKTIG